MKEAPKWPSVLNCSRSSSARRARRAGGARQQRHGAQVRPLPPGVSHQGRHPGDAHRRGHDRAVAGRGLRLSPEDPAHPPAADRRRRAARRPIIRAIRRARPAAHLTYLVEPPAAPVVAGNPHLDEVIVAPLLRGAARLREDAALALRLRRCRFRRGHRLPRRSAQFAARPGHRRPAADRVHDRRPGLDVHDAGPEAAGSPPAPLGREPVGSAEALLPDLGRPARGSNPVEMPRTPPPPARLKAGFAASASTRARTDRHPRRRRQRVPAVAGTLVCRRRRGSGVRAAESSYHPHDRAGAGGAGRGGPAARARARRAGARHLGGLRPRSGRAPRLVARARLFLGGDSGPVHIAATTSTPMVVLYGPTTPEVWGPWRGGAVPTETVDVGRLPCRPCDQRVCEPGDFRCLRGVTPRRGGGRRGPRDGAGPGIRRGSCMKHVPVSRIALWSLFGFVAALQVSIVAAQTLLAVVAVCWVAMLASGNARFAAPAVLPAAARLRRAHAGRHRVLGRSAGELRRRQAATAVPHRAGGLRDRPRPARAHGRARHHHGRRGQRGRSASSSTASCTTTTSGSGPRARSATT